MVCLLLQRIGERKGGPKEKEKILHDLEKFVFRACSIIIIPTLNITTCISCPSCLLDCLLYPVLGLSMPCSSLYIQSGTNPVVGRLVMLVMGLPCMLVMGRLVDGRRPEARGLVVTGRLPGLGSFEAPEKSSSLLLFSPAIETAVIGLCNPVIGRRSFSSKSMVHTTGLQD